MREQNPTQKRLQWIAERYEPDVLLVVGESVAEAVGNHDVARMFHDHLEVGHPLPRRGADYPQARRWQTTQEALLERARGELPEHTRFDRYLPWLARELDSMRRRHGSRWWSREEVSELVRRFRSVVDWADAERVDLGRVSQADALEAARAHGERRMLEEGVAGRVVHRWDDGWAVQELTTQEQLDAEGDVMQHCVADYTVHDGRVFDLSDNAVQVFSLRDPGGAPHATMEYMFDPDTEDPPFVSQLRGKQNDIPKPEYLERMVEFRLGHLPDVKLVPVSAPPHADGLREPFAGAFETPEQDRILVYEDGTVLMWEDVGDQLDDLRAEALQKFPGDRPAQRQYVIIALDQVEPSELATEDWARLYGLWLPWAVMVATKGRARIRDTEDEMVNWLAGTKVDPSVCRPFAGRAANVSELYQRLTLT